MKKFTPIWMLLARSTLPALLILALATGLIQTLLFVPAADLTLAVDRAFLDSRFILVTLVSFLLWTAILFCPRLRQAAHTLDRLPTTHFQQHLCHVCYNLLAYLVFWGFQVAMVLGLASWFSTQADPGVWGPQSLLLLFYRNDYLHLLLPLHDWWVYVRMVLHLLAFSAAAAYPLQYLGRPRSAYITAVVSVLVLLYSLNAGRVHPMENIGWGIAALILGACLTFWQYGGTIHRTREEVFRDEA